MRFFFFFPSFSKLFWVTVSEIALFKEEWFWHIFVCSDDEMFCAKVVWFSALWNVFLVFLWPGFESDRLDVWFKTWCKETKKTFWTSWIFELLNFFCLRNKLEWSIASLAFSPSAAVDSDLISQMLFCWIDFALIFLATWFFFLSFFFVFALNCFEIWTNIKLWKGCFGEHDWKYCNSCFQLFCLRLTRVLSQTVWTFDSCCKDAKTLFLKSCLWKCTDACFAFYFEFLIL